MSMAVGERGAGDRGPLPGHAGPGRVQVGQVQAATAPKALVAFFLTLPLLFSFELAGMRLSPIRLFLLVAFVPTVLALLRGRAGRITAADTILFAFCGWVILSLLVNDGMVQLPNAFMTAVEMFGGYTLGRILVRNAADFRLLTRVYLGVLIFLLPFALIEFLTGRMILHEIFDLFGTTSWKGASSYDRWGFTRTMSGFDHPILFGLFGSVLTSSIFYVYSRQGRAVVPRLVLVAGATFLSLSSAPLLSLAVQIGLILWDKITRGRWVLFLALAGTAYVTVDLLSNRTPITILINYITFDPATAWTRIGQWNYGTVAVMDHPVFGLGMGEKWETVERPSWIGESVDNFWLLNAMRYGLVGVGLLILGIGLLLFRVVQAKGLTPQMRDVRTGYVIGIAGLCFVLSTVHIWGAVGVLVFFYLGAGAWLANPQAEAAAAGPASGPQRQTARTSRFAHQPGRRDAASRQTLPVDTLPVDSATGLAHEAGRAAPESPS